MRAPTKISPQAGFSMLEMLVTTFILSIGLLGLTALQVLSIRSSGGSRNRGTAAYVAQSVLDVIASEGQLSYQERSKGTALTFTPKYTATPGTAINGNYGSFDVNGQFVSTSMTAAGTVFHASWNRLAYKGGTQPAAASPQVQEFLVNVQWVDGSEVRWLTVNRLVRY